MTIDKERLRVLAEAVKGWSECNQAWLHAEISGLAVVGNISEGNQCPIAEIDADYYEHPGESLKLAEFYAGANPGAVLALLSENAVLEERERHALMAADAEAKLFDEERQKNAALASEVERLRKDAGRYQWLRAQFWHKSNLFVVQGDKSSVMLGTRCPSKSQLDGAIDAAMAAKKDPS